MKRDDLVRKLWLDGYEIYDDYPKATKFVRKSDGASILIPKAELVPDSLGSPRTPHMSPCCDAPSETRRIVGHLHILRCSACERLWERELGLSKKPVLRVV